MRLPDARIINRIVFAAAALSALTGAIHLVAAPEHLKEWWGYGVFFITAGALQLLFAYALVRWPRRFPPFPRRWILGLGIAANVALIVFYVYTRTVGVPLGPERGEIEKVKPIDTVAKTAEAALVLSLLLLASARRRTPGAGLSVSQVRNPTLRP